LKSKRNQEEFEEKQQQLQKLEKLQEQGYVQLYYYDESSFSLCSALPYAWQKKGQTIQIPASKGKRMNVAGLINTQGDFYYHAQDHNITSTAVISFLDQVCEKLQQKTIVVVDNAPTHRSKAFLEKIPLWQEQDLYIFFLPPYSPELNKIEMLWKKIKYYWLDFNAYLSWQNLQSCLKQVLDNVNQKYIINFV